VIRPRPWLVLPLLLLVGSLACDRRYSTPTEPSESADTPLALSTAGGALSLPADGFSTLQITAIVRADGLRSNLSIRFRTTSGTFVGTAAAETPIDVALDGAGRATAVLRSSTRTGPVQVTAQVLDGTTPQTVTAQLTLDFILPDSQGLRFVEGASSAPADGASVTRYTVQIPQGVPLDNRSVAFATTLGSFDGATMKSKTVPAGTDGRASVLLYSPADDGRALLTASIGVFDVERIVEFQPARAETILVSAPARLTETPTTVPTFTVTATLVRRIGTPTAGTVVSFAAFDKTGKRFGAFHNVTLSNGTGVATADFRTGGTGEPGDCRLEVEATGSPAVGRAEFELVRPPS
jgi:hypothetical protein